MSDHDKEISKRNVSGGIISVIIKNNIRQFMMVGAMIVIWIVFTLLTNRAFLVPGVRFFQFGWLQNFDITSNIFLTTRNLSNLFLQAATTAVLAIGVVLVIVTNNIDLSIGSVVGFIGAVAAVLQVNYNWGAIPAILASLAIGVLIGAWHGFWVAFRGVPAFIVTMASMMIFRGGILGLTGGKTVSNMKPWFAAIGQGYLSTRLSFYFAVFCVVFYLAFDIRRWLIRRGYGFSVISAPLFAVKLLSCSGLIWLFFWILRQYKGVPYAALLVLVMLVLFTFIAEKTVFGRHLYAIGGNAEAARLSGINIKKRILQMYMLMGAVSAVGGIVYLARLNAATAQAGNGLELDVIASAVIGGTSLLGGEGPIFGAVVGALVMASLDNGMSLMNLDVTWQYVVKGLTLLLAVWADIATRRKNQS